MNAKSPEVKHTPGPWHGPETSRVEYMGDDYNAQVIYSRDSSDRVPIAFVPLNAVAESMANAALIAAAPSLLEALKQLLADKYLADPINADRMAKARAALAKAEGREVSRA